MTTISTQGSPLAPEALPLSTDIGSAAIPRGQRAAVAVLLGIVTGALSYVTLRSNPSIQGNDFTYPWTAARAILRHEDAYAAVTRIVMPWPSVFFYPLTAGVVALPFAPFSSRLAAALFVGVGCGLLAFLLTRSGWWRLLVLASAPAFHVYWSGQWAALLTAAALLPAALGLVVVKPNLALPLLAYQSSRRAIVYAVLGGALLLAISLIVQPNWPLAWYATVRTHQSMTPQYKIPMLTAWGLILWLPVLRWRRPEARLALAMACVPQTFFGYEQLPLLLVPLSRRELLVAVLLSHAAMELPGVVGVSAQNVIEMSVKLMPYVIAGLYLPAVLMMLRRPNSSR